MTVERQDSRKRRDGRDNNNNNNNNNNNKYKYKSKFVRDTCAKRTKNDARLHQVANTIISQ